MHAVPRSLEGEVQIEGDKVTIRNLTITDPDLANYLSDRSNFEKISLLIDLIETAMQIQRMANSSADVKELNSVAKQVRETMRTAGEEAFNDLHRLIQSQARDDEPGSLISLLKTKLVNQIISELDPIKETSPFHRISEQLLSLLEKTSKDEGSQEYYSNSREKGLDFEELLDQMIQREALVHGDDAQFTGDTPSPTGEKTGDEVVTLNKGSTNGEELRIVWEAKTDKTFKDSKMRLKRDKVAAELESAISNREAECGIFVSDARGIDQELQPVWQEFDGNKLIIVLNDEEPDQRLIRMAYLWSRWIVLRAQTRGDKKFDFVSIERVISALRREFEGLSNLKRIHTPIRENIEKAQVWVNDFESSLDKLIQELRNLTSVTEV
jgi:hypothetical protein